MTFEQCLYNRCLKSCVIWGSCCCALTCPLFQLLSGRLWDSGISTLSLVSIALFSGYGTFIFLKQLAIKLNYSKSLFSRSFHISSNGKRSKSLVLQTEISKIANSFHVNLIFPWYSYISPDYKYSLQFQDLIERCLTDVTHTLKNNVDSTLVIQQALYCVIQHHKRYLEALLKVSKLTNRKLYDCLHEKKELVHFYKPVHSALRNKNGIEEHLRKLSELIAITFLPEDVKNCPLFFIVVRDLLAHNILKAFLDVFLDTKTLNTILLNFLNEYFSTNSDMCQNKSSYNATANCPVNNESDSCIYKNSSIAETQADFVNGKKVNTLSAFNSSVSKFVTDKERINFDKDNEIDEFKDFSNKQVFYSTKESFSISKPTLSSNLSINCNNDDDEFSAVENVLNDSQKFILPNFENQSLGFEEKCDTELYIKEVPPTHSVASALGCFMSASTVPALSDSVPLNFNLPVKDCEMKEKEVRRLSCTESKNATDPEYKQALTTTFKKSPSLKSMNFQKLKKQELTLDVNMKLNCKEKEDCLNKPNMEEYLNSKSILKGRKKFELAFSKNLKNLTLNKECVENPVKIDKKAIPTYFTDLFRSRSEANLDARDIDPANFKHSLSFKNIHYEKTKKNGVLSPFDLPVFDLFNKARGKLKKMESFDNAEDVLYTTLSTEKSMSLTSISVSKSSPSLNEEIAESAIHQPKIFGAANNRYSSAHLLTKKKNAGNTLQFKDAVFLIDCGENESIVGEKSQLDDMSSETYARKDDLLDSEAASSDEVFSKNLPAYEPLKIEDLETHDISPEYEESEDLASTIAKLKNLLNERQKNSLGSVGSLSSVDGEPKNERLDPTGSEPKSAQSVSSNISRISSDKGRFSFFSSTSSGSTRSFGDSLTQLPVENSRSAVVKSAEVPKLQRKLNQNVEKGVFENLIITSTETHSTESAGLQYTMYVIEFDVVCSNETFDKEKEIIVPESSDKSRSNKTEISEEKDSIEFSNQESSTYKIGNINKNVAINVSEVIIQQEQNLSENLNDEAEVNWAGPEKVSSGRRRLLVKRRFSEFLNLHAALESDLELRAAIKGIKGPNKWSNMSFGKLDSATVMVRKKFLEKYLQTILLIPAINCSQPLKTFLACDKESISFEKKFFDGVPRLDKFLARTVSDVFNTLKTALPNFEPLDTPQQGQPLNPDIKNIFENKDLTIFSNNEDDEYDIKLDITSENIACKMEEKLMKSVTESFEVEVASEAKDLIPNVRDEKLSINNPKSLSSNFFISHFLSDSTQIVTKSEKEIVATKFSPTILSAQIIASHWRHIVFANSLEKKIKENYSDEENDDENKLISALFDLMVQILSCVDHPLTKKSITEILFRLVAENYYQILESKIDNFLNEKFIEKILESVCGFFESAKTVRKKREKSDNMGGSDFGIYSKYKKASMTQNQNMEKVSIRQNQNMEKVSITQNQNVEAIKTDKILSEDANTNGQLTNQEDATGFCENLKEQLKTVVKNCIPWYIEWVIEEEDLECVISVLIESFQHAEINKDLALHFIDLICMYILLPADN